MKDMNGFDMKKMRDVHYSGQGTNELHTIDTETEATTSSTSDRKSRPPNPRT